MNRKSFQRLVLPIGIKILAKHEGMNEKSSPQNQSPTSKLQLTRVARMLHRLQDCLHNAVGTPPTYQELAQWTGVAERTIKDWCNNRGRPTAEFALQLLERVPETQRYSILGSVCRLYPTLEHPGLKCDQTTLSRLRTLVSQSRDLVFIQGDDESRTFLLTAMGHAFLGLTARPHELAGLDAHEPDWFVPLPGVKYLGNLFQPGKLLQAVRENWPVIAGRGEQMIVFNATGVMLGDFQREIKALNSRCPVIVADAAQVKLSVLRRASCGCVHVATVCTRPDRTIAVALESL